MDKKLQLAGMVNAWTMPIKDRIDMLSTGIRTPIGIKILGPDLEPIQQIGKNLSRRACKRPRHAQRLRRKCRRRLLPRLRVMREEIARYGLAVEDVEEQILIAVGGMM